MLAVQGIRTKLFYATSKHNVPSLYQIGETTATMPWLR
jgi:hypothetical protein